MSDLIGTAASTGVAGAAPFPGHAGQPASPAVAWPTDLPVVRAAGLPVAVLTELSCARSAAAAYGLVVLDQQLAATGDRIADHLYRVIGELTGADQAWAKPALVGLRRAVHRGRRPAAREWSPQLAQLLPADLAERIDRWLELRERRGRDYQRLVKQLDAEQAQQSRSMRRWAADPWFRRGLWQASPVLSQEVDRWLAADQSRLSRQTAFRLAKYLTRAAAKTSPFGTFTVSGFASWEPTAGAESAVRLDRPAWSYAVPELFDVTRHTLIEALVRHPALADSLRVRLNPSVHEHGDGLRFLGPPPPEPILTVGLPAPVRECLRVLRTGVPGSWGELRRRLAPESGAAPGMAALLERLRQLGLIETHPPVASPVASVAELARWVAEHGAELAPVADLLDQLAERLSRPAGFTNLAGYRASQQELAGILDRLGTELGTPLPPQGQPEGASPVREAVVAGPGPVASCAADAWRPALRDLDQSRGWLAILDPALPLQLALDDWFVGQFGDSAEVPFLAFHRALQEQLGAGGGPALEMGRLRYLPAAFSTALDTSHFPRLRELHRLRQQLAARFQRAPSPAGGVWLDNRELVELARGWPPWVAARDRLSCYLQPVDTGGGPLAVVLNALDGGYGRGRSRVAHLLNGPAAADPVPDPAGTVLAELGGGYGMALNLRPPTTGHELAYPYSPGARPEAEQLSVTDLVVGHDPGRQLLSLRLAGTGTEVRVLHLGLTSAGSVPPAARLLTSVFGDLSLNLNSPLADLPVGGAAGAVRRTPRIQVGQVVMRRAQWGLPREQFPRRAAGERDADYLLRLTAFRQEHGIPPRCFVRAPPPERRPEGWWDAIALMRARKPMYVDFANWLLVVALENLLRSPGQEVTIEEALPDPATAPSGRVTELLVELPGGGPPAEA